MLVIIYLRVSTEDQAQKGYSLPEQREACRSKAQALARELESQTGEQVDLQIREFVDDFGGDILERPALEEMRGFLREGKAQYFICLDPDRFSRNLLLQLIVTEEIEKAGTTLAFVQHHYDKSAEGQMFYQMRGVIAQYEKTKILERTSRGKRGKVKAGGRPNGACPYGYRHIKETDRLEVFEPEAHWVRLMFEWVATEHIGVHLVARRLTELGVPTKRGNSRWYRNVVAQILRNTAYFGEMHCFRVDASGLQAIRRLPRNKRRPITRKLRPASEWKTVAVPPIIDRKLWEQVQENLRSATKRGKVRYSGLLSLIAYCGVCGGRMAYARHPSRTYLRCQHKYAYHYDYRERPHCTSPLVRAEPVEAGVWNQVAAWMTEPALLAEHLQRMTNQPDIQQDLSRLEREAAALREQQAEKRQEQFVIIRQQASGRLAEEVADQLLDQIKDQLHHLDLRVHQVITRIRAIQEGWHAAREAADRLRDPARMIAAKADDIRRRLQLLSLDQRRALVIRLVRSVVINRDGSWCVY